MAATRSGKGRWVRTLVISGLVVALAVAGVLAFRVWRGGGASPVTYVTKPAAKTTLISSVSGTGNVTAGSTSRVIPSVSGEVTGLSVALGDTVTQGQVLFVLFNPQLDLDVASAETSVEQAEDSVDKAELSVERAEQNLSDLEDRQDSQSAGLQMTPTVVYVSYTPTTDPTTTTTPPTTTPPTTTPPVTTSTTTPTPPTTTPPTTTPPTTPPSTTPPTTTPPPTTPPTTTPPTTAPPGGGGTTPTTAKEVTDLDIAEAEQLVASAKVQVTVAENNLASAEYALIQAEENAAARTVVAPTDGTVTELNVSDGDQVGSSGTSGSTTSNGQTGAGAGTGGDTGGATSSGSSTSSSNSSTAAVITNLSSFEVTLALGETDVVAVQKDDKVTLGFDALPDLTLVGKVDRVASIGTVNSGVVSYDVTVVPGVGNENVRAGMTSTAEIVTESKVDALAVPSSAVKTDQSGNAYVLVLKNGDPVAQTVQTGMMTDTYIEITGGLTEGQAVVTQTVGGTTATTARGGGGGILGVGGGPGGGFPGGGFPGGGD